LLALGSGSFFFSISSLFVFFVIDVSDRFRDDDTNGY
jgi:hypothetical protein